ncbi:hypothetical protein FSP39_017225 [Pinctada imbricata]|uniref:Reelin domain-containing protein n=1 Tax=Pinctada imbricata TaxID=66713 RepID=A0AA88XSM5_PINIB|nr:hypothetical protein FSP39_017225 [Pinctada imbricata]
MQNFRCVLSAFGLRGFIKKYDMHVVSCPTKSNQEMLRFSFVLFLPVCMAFEMKAPLEACWSMFPRGHGYDAQTTTSPYTITVNATSYQPNDVIEVFLDTKPSINPSILFFEGLIIQARIVDCNDLAYDIGVGSFSLQPGENFLGLMDCNHQNASSVGHIAHEHIYNRTFYWHAPSTPVGHIHFRGTVVRRKSTFWTDIVSTVVKDLTSFKSAELCDTSGVATIGSSVVIVTLISLLVLTFKRM